MESRTLPTLRPLRLGELLDRAIQLYRRNFLTFIGIIALVHVPLTVLQTAAAALMSGSLFSRISEPDGLFASYGYTLGLMGTMVIWVAQIVLLQAIATGALTRAAADSYLGTKTGILDAYRGLRRSWPKLVGAVVVLNIILSGLLIWWVVPCIGWITGLGITIFVTMVVGPLVPSAVVLENQGVFDGLRRAWSLARRRFWPLLGYVCMLALFSAVVVNGPATIVSVLLLQVFNSLGEPAMQMVLASVAQSLVQLVFLLIYLPLQLTAYTLIYFDLRVRTEGLDLAMLTLANSGSSDLSEVMATPVPQVNERFVTGAEVGNFAILTLAGAGLVIFLISLFMAIPLLVAAFLY